MSNDVWKQTASTLCSCVGHGRILDESQMAYPDQRHRRTSMALTRTTFLKPLRGQLYTGTLFN